MISIVPLYAGILGLMSFALAAVVGRVRGSTGISLGDGGNMDLIVAMRRQANFLEFVPLVLILLALLESQGISAIAIHGLASVFVLARASHAVGMRNDEATSPLRIVGAVASTLVLVVCSVWSIVTFF